MNTTYIHHVNNLELMDIPKSSACALEKQRLMLFAATTLVADKYDMPDKDVMKFASKLADGSIECRRPVDYLLAELFIAVQELEKSEMK